MAAMRGPAKDFEDYLAAVPEPARTTLETWPKPSKQKGSRTHTSGYHATAREGSVIVGLSRDFVHSTR